MTTQEVFNLATQVMQDRGFEDHSLLVHNTFTKYGEQWAITVISPELIITQNHKAPFNALFELNTLLTELKMKQCTTDIQTTTNS